MLRAGPQRHGASGRPPCRHRPPLRGRPVKVTDGSTTQLADTPKNQKRHPQSRSQKPGCGFPLLKFVVLFCLQSGAVLHVAMGSLRHHDLRLSRQLWPHLKSGDILLGDRAWGEYTTLAGLPAQGVDVVARLHARCRAGATDSFSGPRAPNRRRS